ncbi:cyclin-dependent kinase G-2-like [Dorcoceras hygrometricum]|uniref:Cyclin-dependent kinase G-2-like n=1 Tax=Dorcoceras hygrometricum TaxID=472368 RepID=A0A2Z6ZWC5_9LAMI|nr:cyclin-dependent kinase G-2-like [Dorcoceras hygrometricum]
MWAVGCIMAELFLEDAIFKGDSEIDQLQKIFGILGTPDDIVWPGFSSLPGSRFKFVEQPFNMLSMNFTIISGLGIDLLNKLLACNPEERITAKDAINHPWFHETILD